MVVNIFPMAKGLGIYIEKCGNFDPVLSYFMCSIYDTFNNFKIFGSRYTLWRWKKINEFFEFTQVFGTEVMDHFNYSININITYLNDNQNCLM